MYPISPGAQLGVPDLSEDLERSVFSVELAGLSHPRKRTDS